jgi:hypothetical protein
VARGAFILDHPPQLAGGRRVVEAEDLDGVAGTGRLELLAAEVVERADPAPCVAGHDRVADLERAAMDEHRRDGPAADVEARLDDRAGRLRRRVRGEHELGVGDEQHLLEQVVEVLLLLRRDVGELRGAAPLLGLEALAREVAAHAVRIRVRDVDFVHGDHDRHLGGARMGDRFPRLRHHAVVCGHDQDGDVGHLRPAGAHGREGFVAGGVEERQLSTVVLDLVGADVLRDPTGLGLDDGALADRVEQRGLPVVDVAHDRHHRRPGLEELVRIVVRIRLLVLLGGVLDRHLALELGGDQLDRLVGERLGDGDHLPKAHHDLDDLGDRLTERRGQLLDGDARLDGNRARRLDDLTRLLRPLG